MFHVDPGWVASAPTRHLLYWHRRARAFVSEYAEALEQQRRLEAEITSVVRQLPRR